MAYRPTSSRPSSWTVTNNIVVPVLAWGLPALVAGVLGFVIGMQFSLGLAFGLGLAFSILITASLAAAGILILPQTEWRVVERLSTFHSLKFSGISLMLWKGVIDTFAEQGDLKAFKVQLFCEGDGTKEVFDFTDGSAPIDAEVWLHIGDPRLDPKKRADRELLTQQVKLYAYSTGDPMTLARSIIEDKLRPLLQQNSIDEAQTRGHEAADPAITEARASLAALGIYPRAVQAIMINDVELPPEIVAMRAKRLEGETSAQEEEAAAMGPTRAIMAIQKASKGKDGTDKGITFEEAQEIYFRRATLDTIAGTGANVSFVASDMNGVVRMVDVGKKE